LPQTSGVRSGKQIHVVSFVTQARAFILSEYNIVCTPRGGRTSAGFNVPVAFLVFVVFLKFLFRGHLPQTPGFCSAKQLSLTNFSYTTWARILSDRILHPGGRRRTARLILLGLLLLVMG